MAEESFQYALLRVMPSLDRGEALNVGIALHCRRGRFLGVRTLLDEHRLRTLDPEIDLEAIRSHLNAISRIAAGEEGAGPLSKLDRSDRFGWIVANSDTIVRPSPVHTGISADPEATLERLFETLVSTA
ncbi:DUF3037 domain-containing protein [soil metagenome]